MGLPPCFSIIFEMFCTLRVFQVQSGDYCICILLYMMLLQQRSAVRVKTYGNPHFPNFPEQEWPDMLSLFEDSKHSHRERKRERVRTSKG